MPIMEWNQVAHGNNYSWKVVYETYVENTYCRFKELKVQNNILDIGSK